MRSTCVLSLSFLVLAAVASAGDVTVSVNGGKLNVQGSSGDDAITIDQAALPNAKQYRVTPGAGTTVNGNASAQVFTNVSGDLVIELGAGTNVLSLTALRAHADVALDAGNAGSLNAALLEATVDDDLRATSSGANMTLSVMTTRIGGDVRVNGGSGIDQLVFPNLVLVKGDLKLDLGAGVDLVDVEGSTIHGHATVQSGPGADTIAFDRSSLERDLRLSNSGDNDSFEFSLCRVADDLNVKCGSGSEQFDAEVLEVSGKATLNFGAGGSATALEACTFHRDLVFRAGAGQDAITVGDVTTIAGDLDVKLGSDPSFIEVANSFLAGRFTYKGGPDDDDVVLDTSSIEKDIRISLGGATGPATNSATIMILTAGGDLSVNGGDQNDVVSVQLSLVQDTAKLKLHDGNHAVSLIESHLGAIDVQLGSGNDATTIGLGSTTRNDLRVNVGGGNNASTIVGVVVGDDLVFRAGNGNDATTIDDAVIGGKLDVNTGGGTDAGP